MIEIEIKARAGIEALRSKLMREGAASEKTVEQMDLYFNAPHRDFARTDEALRLRSEEGRVFLTYKGKKLDAKSKTRKEVEVEVGDFCMMEDILVSIGFTRSLRVRKTREIYHLGDAVVCLDRVDGLGEFVEMETLVADTEGMEKKRDWLIAEMRRLGVAGELIRESYLEMLMKKK
jgi:adenylate cyclase class 2